VAELIEIVARARGKQEPLSAEFLLLDQTQTVVERASNRIGMPIDFGRLAQAAIQGVIQKNFKQLYACYEEGLSRNPKLRGKIVLRFVVAPAGNVSEVAAIDQGRLPQGSQVESLGGRGGREAGKLGAERFISDTTVTSCVLEAYRGFQFPKPEGGPVKVIYPLVFSPR
jgi:hypothetical protein